MKRAGAGTSGPEQERAMSVTAFSRCVKELLEGSLPPCWVRGEISNLRQQASGHVYFSLKDAGAQVSAVLFRGDMAKLGLALRDGMQVIAYGSVDYYETRGQLQLVVRVMVEDGLGRLQQEFEILKRKLADEGLFEADRKQPVPVMPSTVGFITSPTGAAVQDFIRILERRGWRGRLVVLPAKVQGAGAAEEMIAQLKTAVDLGVFDLLVIGRGGGSLEDLWAFNEEVLVRAVSDCPIPIISAVGHEIDFTLCDFAADVRAETPSAAAELISSRFVSCCERLERLLMVRRQVVERRLDEVRARLEHGSSRLRLLSPLAVVERGHLRLDDLTNRLSGGLGQKLRAKRHGLEQAGLRFRRQDPQGRVELESQRLLSLWKRLQSASPQSVLKRGFVIIRDEQGKPVGRATDLKAGQRVGAQFADGTAGLQVDGGG